MTSERGSKTEIKREDEKGNVREDKLNRVKGADRRIAPDGQRGRRET